MVKTAVVTLCAGAMAVLGALAWFNTPLGREDARRLLESALREHIPLVSLGALDGFVPFSFAIEGVRVDAGTGRTAFDAARITLTLDPWSWFRGRIVVRKLALERPRWFAPAACVLTAPYAWLIARGEAPSAEPLTSPGWTFERLVVERGSIQSEGRHSLRDVTLEGRVERTRSGRWSFTLERLTAEALYEGARWGLSATGSGQLLQRGADPQLGAGFHVQLLDVARDSSAQLELKLGGALPLLDVDLRLGSGTGGALWLAGFLKLPRDDERLAYGLTLQTSSLDPREFWPLLPRAELNLRVDVDGVGRPLAANSYARLDLALQTSSLPGTRLIGAHALAHAEGTHWRLDSADARVPGARFWLRGQGTHAEADGELDMRSSEGSAALGPLSVDGTLHAHVRMPLLGVTDEQPLRVAADAQISRLRYGDLRLRNARVSLQAGWRSPLRYAARRDGELFVQTGAFRLNGKRMQPLRIAFKTHRGQLRADAVLSGGEGARLPSELFPWAADAAQREAVSRTGRGPR